MEKRLLTRMTALLLCLIFSMCMLCSMGAAYAADADGVSVQILLPADWANRSTSAKICVEDGGGVGFSSVQVKVGPDETWKDITNELERQENRCYGAVPITDNCTIYIRVTGHDGQVYENSRYIECFDRTPPSIQEHLSGDSLRVECSDDLSGVSEVSINGKSYPYPANEVLNVPLKDIGSSSAQITLQATDRAGNTSKTIQVKNTNYQKSASNTSSTSSKPAAAKSSTNKKPSVSAVPVSDNQSKDSSAKPLTPDGQGPVVDNVTDEDSKEFFTIETQDDNTFYLVIDRQRDNENVYLLDTVKESDLISMSEKDTEQPTQTAVPEPDPVCFCKERCAAGEVNTDCPVFAVSLKNCTGNEAEPADENETKPEKTDKNSIGMLILVALAALAAGGIGWYFKIYRPKKALDDAENFDDLIDDEEEEMVNEDEQEPKRDPYGEPNEPDYPDDYYGEPEDGP